MRPVTVAASMAVLVLGGPVESRPSQVTEPEAVRPQVTPEIEKDDRGSHLVATSKLAAELSAGEARERVSGRVSMHLLAPATGEVSVRGFNVVFTGVSQRLLAGRTPVKEPLGLLAFAVTAGKPQTLRFDRAARRVSGQLRMFADASFLAAFAEPTEDRRGDLFLTPTLPATATVTIEFEAPIQGEGDESRPIRAKLDLRLRTEPFRHEKFEVPALDLRFLEPVIINIDRGWFRYFEVARRLCVQPVRLLRFSWRPFFPSIKLSGEGLPFGEPGSRTEWAKADIRFQIRDWQTLWAGAHWVMDSTEANALRGQVEDDDCIEVFFVYNFSPESQWGGGATFGSGTATAQIISSDANARYAIDLTHLAHELGHVLGLRHPGDPATASAVPASTGTLLCPSGFKNDNPRVNSQENEDILSNPLLTFALKLVTPGPDCDDSADCGPCP